MIENDPSGKYEACRDLLLRRLGEPAPGRIQLLTGPRQVGKTTLLLELEKRLGRKAIYAACDGPEAAAPGFWERLWSRAEELSSSGKAVVLLDEIHLIQGWSARLKGEWDRLRRLKLPLHVVATGSSALHVSRGSRESLAGRFERTILPHWSAAQLARTFRCAPERAAQSTVRFGSYPGAVEYLEDLPRWRAYVVQSIVEPAIGRDILALTAVRRPALLRQVFSLAIAMPAQIVALLKLQGQLAESGALETIAGYLALLEEAYLVAALEKFSTRAIRRRAAPAKLVTLNNALLSAADPRDPPEQRSDPVRFGQWVENACLAHAWNSGQRVMYWREEPYEVDGVIDGSWGRWAIEVKTGRYSEGDLAGLLEFTRRHSGFRPLVLTDERDSKPATRVDVPSLPWKRFLLGDLPGQQVGVK